MVVNVHFKHKLCSSMYGLICILKVGVFEVVISLTETGVTSGTICERWYFSKAGPSVHTMLQFYLWSLNIVYCFFFFLSLCIVRQFVLQQKCDLSKWISIPCSALFLNQDRVTERYRKQVCYIWLSWCTFMLTTVVLVIVICVGSLHSVWHQLHPI